LISSPPAPWHDFPRNGSRNNKTLITSGHGYPPATKSAEVRLCHYATQQLRYYATQFPWSRSTAPQHLAHDHGRPRPTARPPRRGHDRHRRRGFGGFGTYLSLPTSVRFYFLLKLVWCKALSDGGICFQGGPVAPTPHSSSEGAR
jgi:hypothetical protein